MTSSETPRRASVLSTAFNLINCAIGAGVLGVPFAVRSMGAVLGALSLCLVMAISVLTLNVLTRAARAYGASSYQELVRKSMGWFAAHVVSLTLIAYVFGSCVAYTIVCADSFGEFNKRAFGSGSIAANRSVIVLFTSTCVMLPLSLLRSMERMAFASSFSVLALLYTAVVVVAKGFNAVRALFFDVFVATMRHRSSGGGGPDHDFLASKDVDDGSSGNRTRDVRAWVLDPGTVLALPVLVFAFQCHVQVVSIFAELRDPSRATRKPSSFVQAAAPGIEPATSAHESERSESVMNGGWGEDFRRGNDEVNEDESEGSDGGDVFVDATSRSDFSGLSSLASSRGGSPAPTGGAGGAEDGAEGAEGADAGTHARRRSSGASGSTLSMILSPSPARRPNRSRRGLFSSSSSSVGVGAPLGTRTREGEAERAELDRSVTMERVSFWSMSTCLAGYLAIGVFAYVAHPDVPSNLLDAYPADDLPMLAASVLMGLSCAASYPINHFASRAALDDLYVATVCFWKRRFKKTRRDDSGVTLGDDSGVTLGPTPAPPGQAPAGRHYTQTVAFVASTTALALAVDDLGVVFQLVGATAGAAVIFILPGILLLLPGYHRPSGESPGPEREPDEESGGVGGGGVRTRDDGTHARAASRHWTEMGDSIGGYDELTFSGALDAPLLPGDGPNDGGVGVPRGAEGCRGVPRGAAALGTALVCTGGVIAAASVHLIFFADDADGAPGSGFV